MNLHNLRLLMEVTGWLCWGTTLAMITAFVAAVLFVGPQPCKCGAPWDECDHV